MTAAPAVCRIFTDGPFLSATVARPGRGRYAHLRRRTARYSITTSYGWELRVHEHTGLAELVRLTSDTVRSFEQFHVDIRAHVIATYPIADAPQSWGGKRLMTRFVQ